MKNVDSQEIKKFDTIADQWWNLEGDFKTLHDINPLRTHFITEKVPLSGLAVLDVGCGGGILSESLLRQGAIVTGIDLSREAIHVARQHAQQHHLIIEYHHLSVEAMAAQRPASFDVITCMELLEHVPDPQAIIRACATLLKPQGHLFLSTLNRNWQCYLQAILGAEYILRLLPRGTHDYARFIKPSELETYLREAQLNLVALTGLKYNPLTRSCKLHRDVSVNYLAYARSR